MSYHLIIGDKLYSSWSLRGALALELAGGKALNEVTGVVPFAGGPKGVQMNAFFIAPVAITKDNLDVVIDAGWVSKDVVCQGVAAGSVAACD